MRRKDREVTDLKDIIGIMESCDVCRLALNDNGYPYILPLNFGMAVNGEKIILYFHSALEGYKVGLIQKDNRASFEDEEKIPALKLLMAHYHGGKDVPFSTASVPRTLAYALEVENVTGKRKSVKKK